MINKVKLKSFLAMILVAAALVFIITLAASAAPEQRVYDQAGLLTDWEVGQLEEKIVELKVALLLDIVIVTTLDAKGKTSRAYADDFYDDHGFGTGSDHDGLLYLIDMDNREFYISTSGSAIDYLTDARINLILDHAEPYVIDADYYRSGMVFLDEVSKYVRSGIPEGQHRVDESEIGEIGMAARLKRSLWNTPVYLLISFLIGAVVVGIMAAMNRGTVKTTATTYLDKNSMNLVNSHDKLINTQIRQTKIHTPSSGSGGVSSAGSRSTIHRSSSGRTHGGGGRKF